MKKIRSLMIFSILFTMISLTLAPISTFAQENVFEKKAQNQLPMKDIKRFVTAIAVIRHYYIKKVTDSTLFDNAISGMVSNLDPHSSFLNKEDLQDLKIATSGQFAGIGIEIIPDQGAIKVISPIDDTPAAKAGIKAGDLIIKINEDFVKNMTLREAVKKIRGKIGTKVKLTIIRKGKEKPLTFDITRNKIKLRTIKSRMLDKGYGYIRLGFFQGPVDKQLDNAIIKLKKKSGGKLNGLILDLRNNPGGLLNAGAQVADTFLTPQEVKKYKGLVVYTKGRVKTSQMEIKAKPQNLAKGTPMIVLINGGSASAAEIVAGALQDYNRAIIMGTRSFGKGSVQTVLPISADSAIKLTTALYYTPAGRSIQARGIEPDVIVPQLQIKEAENDNSDLIDEADLKQHLKNGHKRDKKKIEQQIKQQKAELKIAKEDYQLYEALKMLKGLHAMNVQ